MPTVKIRCPHCRNAIELLRKEFGAELTCPSCHSKVDVSDALSMEFGKTRTISYSEENEMPKPGEQIGHFRIERELGKGGFGSVYSAFDLQLQRRVAIKVPRMLEMKKWQAEVFVREARTAAQLRDSNIVAVHEVGRDGDRVYIVSDLIEGVTLREWMDQAKPDPRTAAQMLSKVAKAIHRAHQSGIIHRDLKPRNILVDYNHEPHVTDFGLAKRDAPEEITLTADGQVVGTPAYMSPEQVTGRSQHADARTDVYALGVVLYEMLTGTRPYRGDSDLLVNEITGGQPTPPQLINPRVPKDVEAICLRAMSLEPADRFLSAAEFAEDLDRFVAGQPTRTRPPGQLKKMLLLLQRYRYQAGMAAALLFGLLGWALTWSSSQRPVQSSAKPEVLQLKVRLLYEPADAEVQLCRYEDQEDTRISVLVPVAVNGELKDGAGALRLAGGMYQVRLAHPRYGTQTFLRRVPDALQELREFPLINGKKFHWAYNNYEKLGSSEIKWQAVEMKPPKLVDANTVALGSTVLKLIPGGEFLSGAEAEMRNKLAQFPTVRRKLPPFFAGETEVTVGEFQSVMGFLPPEVEQARLPADHPVSYVTWSAAVEYCERVGGRLPTFDEYVYTCNRGLTRFPWGDSVRNDAVWAAPALKLPDFDVTASEPRIFNLYSSQLEWTADRFVLPVNRDPQTGQVKPWPPQLVLSSVNSRIYVGGPTDPAGSKYAELPGVRQFGSLEIDKARAEMGFRVYLDPADRAVAEVPTGAAAETPR